MECSLKTMTTIFSSEIEWHGHKCDTNMTTWQQEDLSSCVVDSRKKIPGLCKAEETPICLEYRKYACLLQTAPVKKLFHDFSGIRDRNQ